MSLANRLWGAPRIHAELAKLGIEVALSTVQRYMVRRPARRPEAGPSWQAFLRNHLRRTAAVDFVTVATVNFKVLPAVSLSNGMFSSCCRCAAARFST